MRRGWSGLPSRARVAIILLSLASLAAILFASGVQARILGLDGVIPLMQRVLQDPSLLRNDPSVLHQYTDLLVWLSTVFLLMAADGLVNLAVCVMASARKTYPPGRDKATWVAALWATFLLLQLPTGLPAALAYWWFIVRPARRLSGTRTAPPVENG